MTGMIRSLFIFCCLFVAQYKPLLAQEDSMQQAMLKNMLTWYTTYPQEKVFLQTNKEQYAIGESIWMKLWCTFQQKPSFLSRIVYVDIADANGVVIDKKMFRLDSLSAAKGQIDISTKWPTGTYTISAYTLWMRNFPDYLFRKNIVIYGEDYVGRRLLPITPALQVRFFPEGGQLINGVDNRIAFLITDERGWPVNKSFVVVDQNGKEVAKATATHNGMGVFSILPENGNRYSADVQIARGSTRSFALPKAAEEGIVLQVQNSSASRLFVSVNRADNQKARYNRLLLIAHMSGKLVYSSFFNFEEGLTTAAISKRNLAPGVMQITILDSSGLPLAERLAFIENYQLKKALLQPLSVNSNKRAKNTIDITADSLLAPSLSVLVNEATSGITSQTASHIAAHLLLTADLQGYIHQPADYFKDKTPETLQKLDLLMMVQGWRKFTWQQIAKNAPPKLLFPIESNINIRGLAHKPGKGSVVKDGKVSFVIKGADSTTILADAYLTDKGEFIVDSLNIKQKAAVSYVATNNKKENLIVEVDFYPSFIDTLAKTPVLNGLNMDTMVLAQRQSKLAEALYLQLAQYVDTLSGYRDLGNVTVVGKKQTKLDSLQREYVSGFFEQSDQTLVVPEANSFMNIWQYLQREVPGLNVQPFAGGVPAVSFQRNADLILGTVTESGELIGGGSDGIRFFLNEMPVSIEIIDAVNPDEVAMVKVYKGALAFPFGANAGAIAVYTKKGRSAAINEKRFVSYEKQGYAIAREFFQVDYLKAPDYNKNQPDTRTMLLWKPELILDKSGKARLSFFNNDFAKRWKVVVQGIDSKGQMVFSEAIVE
jgi:hypothetical protein